ncbi:MULTISPECIES: GntR family transcriptional regulator [Marinobacter]|uniref:GntR family transcriptional regulator n=1 Tax=Marinobacter TaxID=2742 RepID=UPI003B42EFB5|nr:GntR family transcriptional regulator [Marinobacter alkaliphilus]
MASEARAKKQATGTTIGERLVRALEDEIVSGRQVSGVRLDEQRLADWFGVSRTPVREALRELVATGLVEKRPHQGFIVKHLSQDDLSDLFETMAVLEATCGRFAAERMNDDELKHLLALFDNMKEAVINRATDCYDQLNLQFHGALYRGAHNRVLVQTANNMRRRTAAFRRAQFQLTERIAASHQEHEQIVNAIISRDGQTAYNCLYAHTLSTQDSAREYLTSLSSQLVLGSSRP